MAVLSDAGRLVAHAAGGGAGNKTLASARAASRSPLLIQPSLDQYDTRPNTSGQFPGVHYNIPLYQRVPTQTSQSPFSLLPSAGQVGKDFSHGFNTGVGAALGGPLGVQVSNWLNPGHEIGKVLTNAGQGLWHAFGFGGGDKKPPAPAAQKPADIVLGPGKNTPPGTTGAGPAGTQLPGVGAIGSVMKGLDSGAQVPQPTYQTVGEIGYNKINPYLINPYFSYTDPYHFDITADQIPTIDPNQGPTVSVPPINNVPQIQNVPSVNPSFIDLNNIPSVQAPQMSAQDQAAAGNLLNTGLNLQTLDWPSLMAGAGSIASAQYGPMVQSIVQQAKNAANTIQGYTSGAREALQGDVRDVGQIFSQAAQANTALDQGILNTLSASNPNITQQAQLESLGVDPTTRAQIAAQNTQGYDTTGAVMSALGDLNAKGLNTQGAALRSYISGLPAQIALGGQQALATASTGLTSDLAKVATQEAKDAWQMAKDMGASDQAAGKAYQNAFGTTMTNFYKGAGLSVSAAKARAANYLSAAGTNVGTDLKAQTANQGMDYKIQAANQGIDFKTQAANQGIDYKSQVANQTNWRDISTTNAANWMKGLTSNQSTESRIAMVNEGTAAGIEKINASNSTRASIANQGAALSADKANLNAKIQNNYHNAQIYMQALKQATSEENARTNRGRLALALYKVMNPTAPASQAASGAKTARDWFEKRAGYVPMSYSTQVVKDANTGTTRTVRTPTYSNMNYGQMITEYAQSLGNTQEAYAFATNMANSVVNPGYRGRPLDQPMADALAQAGIDPTIQQTKKGVPFLTAQQATFLNDNGWSPFAHEQLEQWTIANDDGSLERVFKIIPLQGAQRTG
jgi:hypothetical protein